MKKTLGQLCDELSIVNIKIYVQEDLKRNQDASDKQIAEATRKTNNLNMHRNALIDAIDELGNQLAEGKKQHLFGSNKSYGKNS